MVTLSTRLRSIGFAALAACASSAALAQGAGALEPISLDNTAPAATKLVLLLVVFVFLLISVRRVRFGHIVGSALIWLGIGFGLVALYAYREPLEMMGREMASVLSPGLAVPQGESVVVRRAWQGQFVVRGEVEGAPVDFIFDTGASTVVLSADDAARAGFEPGELDYRIPVMTASGMTRVAPVRLGEIRVGSIAMPRVRAAIARPGDLEQSLLGMTFLDRLSGYEVSRDRLVLNP